MVVLIYLNYEHIVLNTKILLFLLSTNNFIVFLFVYSKDTRKVVKLFVFAGTQKSTYVSHLFVVYALNFEATSARVPFAALRERTERDDEMDEKIILVRAMREEGKSYSQIAEAVGYKSKTSVMKLLREEE